MVELSSVLRGPGSRLADTARDRHGGTLGWQSHSQGDGCPAGQGQAGAGDTGSADGPLMKANSSGQVFALGCLTRSLLATVP